MTKGELETEQRLTRVETRVDEIADNHLAHIANDIKDLQKSVSAIDIKLAYWSGAITLGVYLLDKFFK